MLLFTTANSTVWDSLSIRVGAGLEKPIAENKYSSSIPGYDYSRKMPTLPTVSVNIESSVRCDWLEGGLNGGVDGEIISVYRLETSGFSFGHLNVFGSIKVFGYKGSNMWAKAGLGLGYPMFRHDETLNSDVETSLRKSLSVVLASQRIRAVFGYSVQRASFSKDLIGVKSRDTWNLEYYSLIAYWDWIAP